MKHRNILLLITITLLLQACSGGSDPVKDSGSNPVTEAQTIMPKVYIVSPVNGATVTSPVTVEFGIEGFSLAPAGTNELNTGHHHLLVDTSLPTLDQPIPSDSNHLHFGKAQDATVLELEPGEHTLQLLLGDGGHIPHTTALISDPIVITVVAEAVE
jgi:hypothetical protein